MLFLTRRVQREFLDTCARIQTGSLRLHTPEGEIHDFGQGSPVADMQIHDWAVVTSIAARGDIGLGETYVAGLWETSSVSRLAEVALRNFDQFQGHAHAGFWNGLKFNILNRLIRANTTRGAARNITAHYDVGNEFFQLWLDAGMTYSSAIFAGDDTNLLRGQNRKYDRILHRLKDAERLLELGSGWGGFAERAAEAGHHVTGLTISPSQKGYADARLDGRAAFHLQDYRASSGTFDSIVSIEMIEAVGQRYWPAYFGVLKARLAESGRVMLQAITVPDESFETYRRSSDFIRHHTFPGGMLLSTSMIADQAKGAGLKVTDTHEFGLDYARTCAIWAGNLLQKAPQIKRLGYGENFLRGWRYYLEVSAAAFAVGRTHVVQMELAHA